MKVVH